MRYGDHAKDRPGTSPDRDLIMHALLRVGDGTILVSDAQPSKPVTAGCNVQVTLHWKDVAEMTRAFDELGASGTVLHPLHDAFWGARFGTLVDGFGVHWMFSCDPNK